MNEKIDKSIKILKFAEKFSEAQGFKLILAYSGGKDSEILLDLAKKAGINFEAVFNNTTIENTVTCKFIRAKQDKITWLNPPKNFYQICMHKKALPSIFRRFCCRDLKERKIKNSVTLFGIRKCESESRAKFWNEFSNRKKKQLPFDKFQKLFDEKCRSKSVYFNPLFEWSNVDVWNYIETQKLEINPIYEKQNRCGCWLCPFASYHQKMQIIRDNPLILKPLIKTVRYLIDNDAPITRYIPDLHGIIEWFLTQKTMAVFTESRKKTF